MQLKIQDINLKNYNQKNFYVIKKIYNKKTLLQKDKCQNEAK